MADADAPGAVGERECAVLFGDGRRLEDADDLDVAASAASDISPGWILRGLPGFFLMMRGSTRRSSI